MILSCFLVTGKTFFHFFYPFSFSLFFLFLGRWPVPSRAGLLSFSLPRRPISFSPPSPLPAQVGPFFFFLPLSRFSHRPGNPTRQPLLPPPAGFGRDSAMRLGRGPACRGRTEQLRLSAALSAARPPLGAHDRRIGIRWLEIDLIRVNRSHLRSTLAIFHLGAFGFL